MHLMDIKTLQLLCASMDDPNAFLASILNAVGLNPDKYDDGGPQFQCEEPVSKAIEIAQQRQIQNWFHEPNRKEYVERLESEFLLLLIRVLNARFEHTSEMTSDQDLRDQLLHHLALDFFPWSKISQHFYKNRDELNKIEEILPQITITREIGGVKCYAIKPELLSEWDRFYVRYESREQSEAFKFVEELLRSNEQAKVSIYQKQGCPVWTKNPFEY